MSTLLQTLSGFPALLERERTTISEENPKDEGSTWGEDKKEAAKSELEIAKGKLMATTGKMLNKFGVADDRGLLVEDSKWRISRP